MRPAIAYANLYQSKSNRKIFHEAIVYVDGSSSCNCKGWINNRKCWHVQDIVKQPAYELVMENAGSKAPRPLRTKTEVNNDPGFYREKLKKSLQWQKEVREQQETAVRYAGETSAQIRRREKELQRNLILKDLAKKLDDPPIKEVVMAKPRRVLRLEE